MNKRRLVLSLAIAATVGALTPWVVPEEWLKYVLWACLACGVLFGALAAGSADRDKPESMLLWLAIGTGQPNAKVRDFQALSGFAVSVAYLAGFALGAFGTVHV